MPPVNTFPERNERQMIKKIPFCTANGSIKICELFDKHIKHALADQQAMHEWHQLLMDIVADPKSLLVLRKQKIDSPDDRGKLFENHSMLSQQKRAFICSDNAPAWLFMKLAYLNQVPDLESWHNAMQALRQEGCYELEQRKALWQQNKARWHVNRDRNVFQIPIHRNQIHDKVSSYHHISRGWHIAHIVSVNDRSDPTKWSDQDIAKKFLKFVHPINYFPLPKMAWTRYGQDRNILCYIKQQYARLYPWPWEAFCAFIEESVDCACDVDGEAMVDFTEKPSGKLKQVFAFRPGKQPKPSAKPDEARAKKLALFLQAIAVQHHSPNIADAVNNSSPRMLSLKKERVAYWQATRLWFKAKGINQLRDCDPDHGFILIRIKPTPGAHTTYTAGYVLMSVEELEETFERTLATDSYQNGYYYWPSPPLGMGQFFFAD